MKLRSLSLLLVVTAGVLFTSAARPQKQNAQEAVYVYICNSEGSVAYHSSKECKGLQKCSHTILTVTEEDAISKYNRRACKICY
jgi:hypothetical protein